MKFVKALLGLLAVAVVCFGAGAWITYSYTLRCTKCLSSKHVAEQRLFGIPVCRTSSKLVPLKPHALVSDYERIFGRPCEHILRKDGFSKASYSFRWCKIACGSTSEGAPFRRRWEAINTTFKLDRQLQQRELARATLELIDRIVLPDASVGYGLPLSDESKGMIFHLEMFLGGVKTTSQWRSVLAAADDGFRDVSNLPVAQ